VPLFDVFDHHHLEHAWQGDDGGGGEQDQPRPPAWHQLPVRDRRGGDTVDHRADPACQTPDHIDADQDQCDQLHYRLDRDGRDDAVVLFLGVQVPGAEQDGEQRQPRRDPDRDGALIGQHPALRPVGGEGPERQRHGLELQSDIGGGGDHRDQGGDDAQKVGLAEAGGNQVGDRGDSVAPADADKLAQDDPPADEHQGRTEIYGEEFKARTGGVADGAVEGPGGAVDRQRQRVDERRAQPARSAAFGAAFDEEGHGEQEGDINEAGQDEQVEGHSAVVPAVRGPGRPRGRRPAGRH
jgi:hypothetical protein